jgi:hypothetical protein
MSSSTSNKSDGLIWRHGAGNPPNTQLYPLAAALDSAGDFLTYWEMGGPCQGWSATPDRLNGVAHQTALCGNVKYAPSCNMNRWLLYMAPSQANSAWYYITDWLKGVPSLARSDVENLSGGFWDVPFSQGFPLLILEGQVELQ